MLFKPPRIIGSLLLVFIVTAAPVYSQTATFSGRVTDQNTGLGVPDVAVVALGNQTGTRVAVTNSTGDYSIQMGSNTNVKLRAYRTNFFFNPAVAGFTSIGGPLLGVHPLNFEGAALSPIFLLRQAPILLTEDNTLQALALDSVLLTRDPFRFVNPDYLGTDKQTRIKLLLVDLTLFSSETLSSISVQAIDNAQITHDLLVEDLQKVPGTPWMSQLTVRLPSDVAAPNELRITVTPAGSSVLPGGLASNTATVRVQ